jgi:hypothetical protein
VSCLSSRGSTIAFVMGVLADDSRFLTMWFLQVHARISGWGALEGPELRL